VVSDTSGNSAEVSLKTMPSFAVSNITASAGQSVLYWRPVDAAQTYLIKYNTTAGTVATSASSTTTCNNVGDIGTLGTENYCIINGLANNTPYFFALIAQNTGTNSLITRTAGEMGATPLDAGLTVVNAGQTTASFSWQELPNTLHYTVFGSTTTPVNTQNSSLALAGCTTIAPSQEVTNACTATGLVAGQKYYFVLVANFQSSAVKSSESVGTTVGGFDFSQNPAVDGTDNTKVNVQWNLASQATSYQIAYDTQSQLANNNVYGSTSSTLTPPTSGTTMSSFLSNLVLGNTYYVRIMATNTTNGKVFSTSEKSVTLVPKPVTSVTLTSQTMAAPFEMNLSWPASTGNASITYDVLRGNTAAAALLGSNKLTVSAQSVASPVLCSFVQGNTACKDTAGIVAGGRYFYTILATNSAGSTPFSGTALEVVTKPNAPANLKQSSAAQTTNTAQMEWSVPSPQGNGSLTYILRRSFSQGTGYGATGTAACTDTALLNCTETGLVSGTTYYYVVQAKNVPTNTSQAILSDNSNEVRITTKPLPPTNVSMAVGTGKTIHVSWTRRSVSTTSENAVSGYTVVRKEGAATTWSNVPAGSAQNPNPCAQTLDNTQSSCVDSSVEYGKSYTYGVKTLAGSLESDVGTSTSSSPLVLATLAPTNLVASSQSPTGSATAPFVKLAWSLSPGEVSNISYKVYRNPVGTSTTDTVFTSTNASGTCVTSPLQALASTPAPTTLSCTDTNALPGNTYTYKVSAVAGGVETDLSAPSTVTVQTTAPTWVSVSTTLSNAMTLVWTPSPGNVNNVTYQITRSSNVDGSGDASLPSGTGSANCANPALTAAQGATSLTCTDAVSLSPGKTYAYFVIATAGGIDSKSGLKTGSTATTAPTWPSSGASSVSVNSSGNIAVDFTWLASPGDTGTVRYNVFRDTSSTGTFATPVNTGSCAADVNALTCQDASGLASASTFFYKVSGKTTQNGTLVPSTALQVDTPPQTPTTLAVAVNANTVTANGSVNNTNTFLVSWKAVETNNLANVLYVVRRSSDGTTYTDVSTSASAANTSCSFNALKATAANQTLSCTDTLAASENPAGKKYYYQVRAQFVNSATNTTVQSPHVGPQSATLQTLAPVLQSPVLASGPTITLKWPQSPGASTYRVTMSTTSTGTFAPISSGSGTCNNVVNATSADSNGILSCTHLGASNGNSFYYVATATGAFGTATPNSNLVNISVAAPTNSVPPNITNPTPTTQVASGTYDAASGIYRGTADVLLTGIVGTWTDSSNCTNQWYVNNNPIAAPLGTGTTYTTTGTDNCRVISVCTTCTNYIGNGISCGPSTASSSNTLRGIPTAGILNAYQTRVGTPATLDAGGKNQIQSFLEQMITDSVVFPDIVYTLRNNQNKGSGTTLYDLFCDDHNATAPVSTYTWDAKGILGDATKLASSSSFGIGASNNALFTTGWPSTLVALAQKPQTNFDKPQSVVGYASVSTNSATALGYAAGSATDTTSSPSTVTDKVTATTLAGMTAEYNFLGRSLSGTSMVFNAQGSGTGTAGAAGSVASSATGAGKFLLGGAEGTSSSWTLNGYLPFAAAWVNRALSFADMELLRTKAVPKLGSAVILGTSSGHLLVGCQADGVGDITCPSTATAVYANLQGQSQEIMGITAHKNGRFFYVNNRIGVGNKVNIGQCDRSATPLNCNAVINVVGTFADSAHMLFDNIIALVSAFTSNGGINIGGALGYCALNDDGTINAGSCITQNDPMNIRSSKLGGIFSFNNRWLIGTWSNQIYNCSAAAFIHGIWSPIFVNNTCSIDNMTYQIISMTARTFRNNTRLYVAANRDGFGIYSLNPTTGRVVGNDFIQYIPSTTFNNREMRKVVLGPNAVYLASGSSTLYRCSLDPVTGLVLGTCKQQGNSSGQFTVAGMAYTPTSILFY